MKIKLIICTFGCLSILCNSLAGAAEIGLKGGLNFSNTYGQPTATYFHGDNLLGYNVGLFGDIKLNDFLSVQPEASITLKGIQKSYGFDQNYYFTYLEIPVLLKVNFLTIDLLKMNLLAGPYVSFLLQESYLNSYPLPNSPFTGTYNLLDVGYVLGISFELENVVLDCRFENELNSFFNGYWTQTTPINDVRNSLFMISLGYKFLKL